MFPPLLHVSWTCSIGSSRGDFAIKRSPAWCCIGWLGPQSAVWLVYWFLHFRTSVMYQDYTKYVDAIVWQILAYAVEITAPINIFFIGHSSVSFFMVYSIMYLKSYLMNSEPVLILNLCCWNHDTYKHLLHRTLICILLMVYSIYVFKVLFDGLWTCADSAFGRLYFSVNHSEPFFLTFLWHFSSYIWVVNLHRKEPLFIHLVWASSSRSAVIAGHTMWQPG
jgi:hypothetical protein